MNLPERILVPTEFDRASLAAFDYALELATKLGATELVLLHCYQAPIVSFPDGTLGAAGDLASKLVDVATGELERSSRGARGRGLDVRSILREGDPTELIAEVADEVGADLVVMGTHGRRGLPRVLVGSVAEKAVRTCRVPVLIVHAEDAPTDAIRRVRSTASVHH